MYFFLINEFFIAVGHVVNNEGEIKRVKTLNKIISCWYCCILPLFNLNRTIKAEILWSHKLNVIGRVVLLCHAEINDSWNMQKRN